MDEELWAIERASRLLGMTANALRHRCRRGQIPHFRIGRRYMFRPSELERWLEARRGPSDSVGELGRGRGCSQVVERQAC